MIETGFARRGTEPGCNLREDRPFPPTLLLDDHTAAHTNHVHREQYTKLSPTHSKRQEDVFLALRFSEQKASDLLDSFFFPDICIA